MDGKAHQWDRGITPACAQPPGPCSTPTFIRRCASNIACDSEFCQPIWTQDRDAPREVSGRVRQSIAETFANLDGKSSSALARLPPNPQNQLTVLPRNSLPVPTVVVWVNKSALAKFNGLPVVHKFWYAQWPEAPGKSFVISVGNHRHSQVQPGCD